MKPDSSKENIRSDLKGYFSNREEVLFVYLFGSFVNNDIYRDIDIGIYTRNELKLLQLGTMHAEISKFLRNDFDLVHLNNISKKKPTLAYEIVTKGELLLNHDQEIHTKYKREALLFYFDTAYLREKIDSAFKKRLKENKFGARNYE